MVATIEVLRGRADGIASYFIGGGAAEYYSKEQLGEWVGGAVPLVPLPSEVTKQDLQRLLVGQRPDGSALIPPPKKRQDGKEPTLGFDVTFSVPKSVSALWAVADIPFQLRLAESVREAVLATLAILEQSVPLARRDRGGTRLIQGRLLGALFTHHASRAGQAQIHCHCIIPRACLGDDGRWSAINSRLLHAWTPTLGRVFRAELGARLSRDLGFELERRITPDGKADSSFSIKGVPQSLCDRWSSRRAAIEAYVRKHGDIRSARSRERANHATRSAKKQDDLKELRAAWRREAAEHGFDQSRAHALFGQARVKTPARAYEASLKASLAAVTEHHAHFAARQVVLETCERLQHLGIPGGEIMRRVLRDLESSPEIVALGEDRQERRYTTREMWQCEEKLLAAIDRLKNRRGAVLNDRQMDKALRADTQLSKEQRKAARHLMSQPGCVRVLSGVAGAGKSRTLNVVREGFERAGYQVRGGAISGAAKEELVDQTQIDSRTVASYLYHQEKSRLVRIYDRVKHDVRQLLRALARKPTYAAPPRVKLENGTVLILDEAGMIDTRTLERLIKQVEKAGATLILAGDTQQLPPILAGGPLARVIGTVGSAYLRENWRQQDPADKKAVSLLRDGKVAQALKNYADRGRLHLGHGAQQTMQNLVGVWAMQGGTRRPAQHMIFTQTRAEAREVNRQCQAKRLRSLTLVPGLSIRHGENRFYLGDRVMFHRPYRIAGIENGYRGTVYAVDPIFRNIQVRLDQEPSAAAKAKGHSRYVTIPLHKLGADDVTLGYAATTHKMQGQTIQNAYVLMGDMMTNLEMAYVQVTRGKHSTRIFVDREAAGEELEDLIQAITRSQAKNLAHDLGKHVGPARKKTDAGKSPRRSLAQSHSPDPTLDLGGM